MKTTREQLKKNVLQIMQKGYSIDDAFTHPDIGEDLSRVAYAEAGHDFDDLNSDWEMPLDELCKKCEKIEAEVKAEMLG